MNDVDRPGLFAAASAFLIWGLLSIYWKLLDHVPAIEIMLQRTVWCFVFVGALLTVRSGFRWILPILRNPKLLLTLLTSATIIGSNWFLYIWAVTHEHIVEVSFGYYINPLMNVLIGTVFLRERLNRAQVVAVTIAACGVAWLTLEHQGLPWIALLLALTFAVYGLIRKLAPVSALQGLGIESAILCVPALIAIALLGDPGTGILRTTDWITATLLIAGGVFTALPLMLFAYGARRIPYAMIGMLQYFAPTITLLAGVLLFDEPFDWVQAGGFALIWIALAVFSTDTLLRMRRSSRIS